MKAVRLIINIYVTKKKNLLSCHGEMYAYVKQQSIKAGSGTWTNQIMNPLM